MTTMSHALEPHIDQLFAEGDAAHRDNQLECAMTAYEKLLRIKPDHFGALHRVGIIAVQAGNYQLGVGFLRSALAVQPQAAAAHLDLGNAYKELGQLEQALASYEQALALERGNPDLHYNRANVLHAMGRYEDALAGYRQALAMNPRDVEALNNAGVVLKELGRLPEALESYDRALALHPRYLEAMNNRGNALKELGDADAALQCYAAVLELDPNSADAHFNRGTVMQARGEHEEALECYGRAIGLNPRLAKAYNNRAIVYQQLKRYDDALADCQQAIAMARDYCEAYKTSAIQLRHLKHFETALASIDMAIRLKGDDPHAHDERGLILKELKRHDEALAAHERAMELDEQFVTAHLNRAVMLRQLKRLDSAERALDRAIAIAPQRPEGYVNRGALYAIYGDYERALADYDKAIEVSPGLAGAYWNRSLLNLEHGKFREGWIDHEWRWQTPHFQNSKDWRDFTQPLWLGEEALQGKTILLSSEQGLGDTLQMCRFAPLLAARGAKVILQVQAPLTGLLGTLEGVSLVLPRDSEVPEFDYWCPLMTLPGAFKVEAGSVPAPARYLHSDPARRAHWELVLGEKTRPRVGVVWSGNPVHNNDSSRSMAFADIARIFGDGFQFVALQKEIRADDRDALAAHPEVVQVSEQLADFADTAALCDLMDVVVTVDTSLAHLAGALGKPVWIMLSAIHDWRWLRDRRDSPWYPSATLYRQSALDQWDDVLGAVRQDLAAVLAGAPLARVAS